MPDITSYLVNPQVVEIWVSGPDGANRMFLCSGNATAWWAVGQTNQTFRESFTFLVGPVFGRQEVVRSSCAAGIAGVQVLNPGWGMGYATITNADADWDDESGKVQVKIDVEAYGPFGIRGFDYNVMILAEKAEE